MHSQRREELRSQLAKSGNTPEQIFDNFFLPILQEKFPVLLPTEIDINAQISKLIDRFDLAECLTASDSILFSNVNSRTLNAVDGDELYDARFYELCERICDVRANPWRYGLLKSDFAVQYAGAVFEAPVAAKSVKSAGEMTKDDKSRAPAKVVKSVAPNGTRSVADIEKDITSLQNDIYLINQKLKSLKKELENVKKVQAAVVSMNQIQQKIRGNAAQNKKQH